MRSAPAKIAIIGAGIAGLACAARLTTLGASVTVFDKSGDIGGRLAARRRGGFWHHGAPHVEATDPAFRQFLIAQAAMGHATLLQQNQQLVRAVGRPDMRELSRNLIAGVTLERAARAERIQHTESGWQVDVANAQPSGGFDVLLTAIPAPQLVELLHNSHLPIEPALRAVRMAPRWCFLLSFERSPPLTQARKAPLEAIVNMPPGAEPGAPQHSVLVADAQWSAAHLELEPAAALRQLRRSLGNNYGWLKEAANITPHRWRYAFTAEPLGQTHLYDTHRHLGHMGDWCLGSTAQDAYLSGSALADAVHTEAQQLLPEQAQSGG